MVSDPVKRVRYVQVRMAHGARLTVTQTAGGRTRTLVRRARVRACRQYRYKLASRATGRLVVTASLPRRSERRSTRYR